MFESKITTYSAAARTALALVLICAFAPYAGSQISQTSNADDDRSEKKLRYVEYPLNGVLLGGGWDSFRGLPSQQKCIVFEEQVIPGHDVSIVSHNIVNRFQLNEALKLSMSGSYSGYGAKVSAKASYSKSLDIDQNKTNILTNVEVWKGDLFVGPSLKNLDVEQSLPAPQQTQQTQQTQQVRPNYSYYNDVKLGDTQKKLGYNPSLNKAQYHPVSLTEEARNLILSGNREGFVKQCGDSYVSHIRNGASLHAYIDVANMSREEKEALSASMSASGYGAKLSASIDKSFRTKIETQTTNLKIFQTGGYMTPVSLNLTQFQEAVRGFIKSNDPGTFPVKPFEVGLESYASLHNWPTDKKDFANPDKMSELIVLYWLFDDLRKSYVRAIMQPKYFNAFSLASFENNTANKLSVSLNGSPVCTYIYKKQEQPSYKYLSKVHDEVPFWKRASIQERQRILTPLEDVGYTNWVLETPSRGEPNPETGEPAECPSPDVFLESNPFEITNILRNLGEVTTIQRAMKNTIDTCRGGDQTFDDCFSTQAFEKSSTKYLEKIIELGELDPDNDESTTNSNGNDSEPLKNMPLSSEALQNFYDAYSELEYEYDLDAYRNEIVNDLRVKSFGVNDNEFYDKVFSKLNPIVESHKAKRANGNSQALITINIPDEVLSSENDESTTSTFSIGAQSLANSGSDVFISNFLINNLPSLVDSESLTQIKSGSPDLYVDVGKLEILIENVEKYENSYNMIESLSENDVMSKTSIMIGNTLAKERHYRDVWPFNLYTTAFEASEQENDNDDAECVPSETNDGECTPRNGSDNPENQDQTVGTTNTQSVGAQYYNEYNRTNSVDRSLDKLFNSYFLYASLTPVQVKYSKSAVADDRGNVSDANIIYLPNFMSTQERREGQALASVEKLSSEIRKTKLNTLVELSEGFCNQNIDSALCNSIPSIQKTLDSSNIYGLALTEEINVVVYDVYRRCRRRLFGSRKCKKYRRARNTTEYIGAVVSGEDIKL